MAVAEATNGSAHANPKTGAGGRRTPRRQKGFFGWLFSTIARLATWAAIFTILFRCPSSIEESDETSSFICRPYFRAKGLVSPHIQPYYDQYAAPYVDAAQPYYQTAKVNVIDPAHHYAVHYASPWLDSGKQYAWKQWETNGQPRLAQVQTTVRTQYDKSVAPHVDQASRALEPYYNLAYANAQVAFDKAVLPAYEFTKPYAIRGYDASYTFTTVTVLPAVNWGWNKTNAFLDKAVWPQLRIVYVENVEPQLVRIGERLGRYKLRSRTKTQRESAPTSQTRTESSKSSYVSKPAPQSETGESDDVHPASAIESIHQSDNAAEQGRSPVEPPNREENETDRQKRVREMVTQDLESWQEKFAQQAEDGAAAIEDSVDEIARGMINNNANTTGRALVEQLEKTIAGEIESLKSKISTIVAVELENSQDDTEDEIIKAVRSAGVVIKAKAQLIRGWREDYDAELQDTVLSTADVHFQILEETRSLALQQIGMKWAWTDGVTYKDWAKYHELKSTFSDWTEELKQLIVTHPTLLEAQEASAKIEDDGMSVATAAARELANVKEVAKWKILAEDSTDNFDLDSLKMAIEERERAAREAEEERQRAAAEAEEERERAARQAEEELARTATEAEELKARAEADDDEVLDADSRSAETGTEQGTQEEAVPAGGEEKEGRDEQSDSEGLTVDETVTGDNGDGTNEGVDAAAYTEPDTAEDAPDSGDRVVPIRRPQTRPTEPALSELNDDPPSTSNDAASGPDAGDKDRQDSDDADHRKPSEPPGHGSNVKGSFFGAFAQAVPNRQPVLDAEEEGDDGDYYARATAGARDAYSRAVAAAEERYSMASSVVSVQMYGTPKPVHNNLLSSLAVGYDNAVSAAASRFEEATSRASKGIYGSPTPTAKPNDLFAKAEEVAGRRLREGKVWAEMQYRSALLAMGVSTSTAVPTGIPDRARYNYYAALGAAHDRYTRFLAAASSAWSSVSATPAPTPTNMAGSASSLASAARETILSAANAAGQAAESAYGAATDGIAAVGEAVDESINSLFDSAQEQVLIAGRTLSEVWETVIDELQAEMYGEVLPIGWEEHMTQDSTTAQTHSTTGATAGAAETEREAVAELVSELLGGKEAPFTESVFSRLSAVYASVTKNAGSVASAASSAVVGNRKTEEGRANRDEL